MPKCQLGDAEKVQGHRIASVCKQTYDASCNAEGKVVGTVTLKRLSILQTAFEHTKTTAPQVMIQLGASCFEHEVAQLLMDRHNTHADKHWQKFNLAQQHTTPDTYLHALKAGLNLKSEICIASELQTQVCNILQYARSRQSLYCQCERVQPQMQRCLTSQPRI